MSRAAGVNGTQSSQTGAQQQPGGGAIAAAIPAYLSKWYEVIGKIGEGTYGVVYLARSRGARSRLLAVKTFKPGKEEDGVSPTAVREIMLLQETQHENIVRLDSVHINREDPCLSLAFDYAEHDLYEMLRHHRDKLHAPMDGATVKSVMWQLLNGLSYMEQNWLIHRDLKPSNILVMGDGEEQGRVKIGDFGLARITRAPLRPLSDNGVVVTIWYRAPELLLGSAHHGGGVDVWAAGCIFAELMTLRPLFQGEEKKQPGNTFQKDQLVKIFGVLGMPTVEAWPELEALPHWRGDTEGIRAARAEYPAQLCLAEVVKQQCAATGYQPRSLALELLAELLEPDPAKRTTARRALQHPYFQQTTEAERAAQEPLPGPNAFKYGGKTVAAYPRRTKYDLNLPEGHYDALRL